MAERYDRELMERGAAARQVIADGEDPFVMLLHAVWPDHDWAESAMLARLMACPTCRGSKSGCSRAEAQGS
jgi:hypothetical protein